VAWVFALWPETSGRLNDLILSWASRFVNREKSLRGKTLVTEFEAGPNIRTFRQPYVMV
jgi:hypothetical protein